MVLSLNYNTAHCEYTQIVNISKSFPAWAGRIFSVSTASPFTKAIRTDEEGDRKFGRAFDLFDGLSEEAVRRRNANDSRACNLPFSVKWSVRARQKLAIFQIGFINLECFTRVDIKTAVKERALSANYTRDTLQIIRDARDVIDNATRRVQFYRDANWTDPSAPYEINTRTYVNDRQECEVDTLFAYRVNASWYIRAAATNRPGVEFLEEPMRHFMHEYVPRYGMTALPMVHPSRETGELENSSTITTAWGGTGKSVVTIEFEEMDMPLSMAYNENLLTIDIASDSITPSNIAILALPMAMSLVPVAFIADLNSIGMFAYILVTDVFSIIPFLIKGVELVRSAQSKNTVMMYYHGGNITIGNSQVYVVSCRGEGAFRNTGIVFISIALAAMCLGILLELFAKRVMQKRRASKIKGTKLKGPFGRAVYDETSLGLLGRDETRYEQEFWKKWRLTEDLRKKRDSNILRQPCPSEYNSESDQCLNNSDAVIEITNEPRVTARTDNSNSARKHKSAWKRIVPRKWPRV